MQVIPRRIFTAALLAGILCLSAVAIQADDTRNADFSKAVQIDVKDILNARMIAVAKDGVLVPLRDDIDGAGGLATAAAAETIGNKNAHALPDNATFLATKQHPQVVLNYDNGDATKNQARRSIGEDTFYFAVPPGNYSHLHLFCTSGWGASKIIVKLVYDDQSVERRDLEVPDWFWDLKPGDTYRSYLVDDLGKWDKNNKMIEDRHHAIFALDITLTPGKTLVKIAIHKNEGGIMVFYGATATIVPK